MSSASVVLYSTLLCTLCFSVLWSTPLIAQQSTVPQRPAGQSSPGEVSTAPTLEGFVYIRPGRFLMGSDDGDYDEVPVREVVISKGFYLAEKEVTVGEYRAFVSSTGHREPLCSIAYENWGKADREDHPINCVSWEDARAYIDWLSSREKEIRYRLPTEAEWEYACRAGTSTSYSCGDSVSCLNDHAWYTSNTYDTGTKPVKTKQPNAWGLYDMHGNVWEWLSDWYGPYPAIRQTDPQGPESGSSRVLREGSWRSHASNLRSTNRREFPPDYRNSSLGIRVLMDVQ